MVFETVTPPARLHFILARDAPIGVIFRRGPSKFVQIIKWNTNTDTFEAGQWFRGRIYEKRCDLSPDGTKLIYFAQKFTDSTQGTRDYVPTESDYTYAWTAISKIPYLTALALWVKGDCWNGGGLFETNESIWLNHPTGTIAHKNHQPPDTLSVRSEIRCQGEDGTVCDERFHRDGWRTVKHWRGDCTRKYVEDAFVDRMSEAHADYVNWLMELHSVEDSWGYITLHPHVSEKPSHDKHYTIIVTTAHVGYDTSSLLEVRINSNGKRVPLTGADWADWDQSGRLVYVKNGCVFTGAIGDDRIAETELANFNDNTFEGIIAPDWAKKW